jgi:hypothetical protein
MAESPRRHCSLRYLWTVRYLRTVRCYLQRQLTARLPPIVGSAPAQHAWASTATGAAQGHSPGPPHRDPWHPARLWGPQEQVGAVQWPRAALVWMRAPMVALVLPEGLV